jgi:lysophospholipase L1-like esterase
LHAIKRILKNILLVLVSLLAALFIAEAGLRLLQPNFLAKNATQEFLVLEPGSVFTALPPKEGLPGVTGGGTNKINSQGFRADEIPADSDYRIIAIGGSTTECLILDHQESWPWLLQQDLGRLTGKKVWVGNVGKSGHNTRDHIYQARYLPPQFPDTNAVLLLVGINDFLLRLERDSEYNPDYLADKTHQNRQVRRAFWSFPNAFWSFPKNLYVYKLLSSIKLPDWFSEKTAPDPVHPFVQWRRHRAKAEIIQDLPDLGDGLKEYERNLRTMIKDLKHCKVRAVFMTQPTLWRKDLSPGERDLLWMGYRGQRGGQYYYGVAALDQGMEIYNLKLKQVCREENVECLDLAALLPKDTSVFYDDCHFNEPGARMVAGIIARYFAARPPFSPASSSGSDDLTKKRAAQTGKVRQ